LINVEYKACIFHAEDCTCGSQASVKDPLQSTRDGQWRLPRCIISRYAVLLLQGIMGKFKKNSAMLNNQGIDVMVNRTEEPLMKLKKRSKPLKVRHKSRQ
jgi:hypothetical protein